MTEIGFIKKIKNFLVTIEGLPSCKVSDLVEFESGAVGYVSSLRENEVDILMLTKESSVLPGHSVKPVGKELSIPVGDFLIGRTISPLGAPVDGGNPFPKNTSILPLESVAPSIDQRAFIDRQFDTGVTLVDTLLPLGKGQRELVIGDARSGKTGFVIDVIVNQKHTGVVCVYGCLGKPMTEIRNLVDIFKKNGALDYTVIVASFSSDPAPSIFLTPQTAISVAQYFQSKGKDVLLVLDDMGSHAKIYREISLLSERPPGREAYPGDIFYQHAHLLERAGSFDKKAGGGSITALPLIELDLNDFTSYVPTNLMSMTDGHLLFRSAIYSQGRRPAADIFLSVSRVGQQTQNRIQNELAFRIKQLLSQAEQLTTVSSFSVELPLATQITLRQKAAFDELLKQSALSWISKDIQTVMLALPFTKWGMEKDGAFYVEAKKDLLIALEKNDKLSGIVKTCLKTESLSELIKKLDDQIVELNKITVKNKDVPEANSGEIVDPETWLPKH